MIVEPDFLDHWKVRLLEQLLERSGHVPEVAALLVLRLWAHCQQRRAWVFDDMTDDALAAICRFKGEGKDLKALLLQCKFIRMQGSKLIVHEWDVVNAKLIANWSNGGKGGRRTEPKPNPTRTQAKPNANPQEPTRNRLDREEKIDKREEGSSAPTYRQITPDYLKELKAMPAYRHLDVAAENDKAQAKYAATYPGLVMPKTYLLSWLNRLDPPNRENAAKQKAKDREAAQRQDTERKEREQWKRLYGIVERLLKDGEDAVRAEVAGLSREEMGMIQHCDDIADRGGMGDIKLKNRIVALLNGRAA
jgi:hypothetical protein